ncbi:hypothetical protein C8A01DRAFT_41834 [Parachaetomium inaequale]|uniref:Uncharacterized protein n=1 Tax=Parachaetomium inaequale TaxID=2588326 RepID=A0AAN6P6L4_9PEZI|nr:hypothetical protein C8A01DRAFT_41834 [Parachaetomium inaequale]
MQLNLLILSLATAAAALPFGNLPRDNHMPSPPASRSDGDTVSTQDNHMPRDNHMRRDNNMPSPPSAKPQDNHATRRDNQMPAPPVDDDGN